MNTPNGQAAPAHLPRPDNMGSTSLIIAIFVLTLGHVMSSLMRTMPAMTVDLLARDLACSPQTVVSLSSAYYYTFALCQIPVGVALDRFSVRNLSLCLFLLTMVSAALAAMATTPFVYFLSQALLGIATSGMLMTPMALAARRLPPAKFAMLSGLILSFGNGGMLLSGGPLAFVVESWGWRHAYWICFGLLLCIMALIVWRVPDDRPDQTIIRSVFREARTAVFLAFTPALRGIVALALVALGLMLVLRGVWAGPWLMEMKGLTRQETGNILTLFTVTLVIGPIIASVVDNRTNNRRNLLLVSQCVSVAIFFAIAAGGPDGPLSRIFGVSFLPASYDTALLLMLGIFISGQALIYAMAREAVSVENSGKALTTTNLALFSGTALIQSITAPVASHWGIAAVFVAMGLLLLTGALGFYVMTKPGRYKTR